MRRLTSAIALAITIAAVCTTPVVCWAQASPTKSPQGNFELALDPDWRPRSMVPPLSDHFYFAAITCAPQHCRTPAEGHVAGWTLPRRTEITSVQDVKNRLPIREAFRVLGLALSSSLFIKPENFEAVAFDNGSFGWRARFNQFHGGAGSVHYVALMISGNEAIALDLWVPEAYKDASNATIRELESRVSTTKPKT